MTYRVIWYSKDDLTSRIKEVRESRALLLEREEELVILYNALDGREDCVVDSNGKIIRMGDKPKETAYGSNKPRQSVLKKYQQASVIPKNRYAKKFYEG